jgi:hypothetical protein
MKRYIALGVALLLSISAGPVYATNGQCHRELNERLRTFEYGITPLHTIYIGNNTGMANGTREHPYPQFIPAIQAGAVTPGTEIVIIGSVVNSWNYGGTYEVLLQGTAEHPIIVRGEAGAELVGSLSGWLPAIKISANSSYIVFKDLTFRDGGSHTVHINYAHHIVFDNVVIARAREAALKVSQSDNIFIRYSDISGGGHHPDGNPVSTETIDFVTVHNFYIVKSKIHDGSNTLVMLKGPAENGLVAWNDIYDQHNTEEAALSMGAYTGNPIMPTGVTYEGHYLTAFANNIHNVATAITFKGCHNCSVLNNSISGDGTAQLIRYLSGNAGPGTGLTYSQTQDTILESNILIVANSSPTMPVMQCEDGHVGANNIIRKNLFYKPDGTYLWWCNSIPNENTNVFNFNPQLQQSGLAGAARVANMHVPSEFGRDIAFSEWLLEDKAGACYDEVPRKNVGAFILSQNP